jgi:hypothetical protein
MLAPVLVEVARLLRRGWRHVLGLGMGSAGAAVAWHAARGGSWDYFAVRLMTVAAAMLVLTTMLLGGGQSGVRGALYPGILTTPGQHAASVIRAEIRASEEQAFHPLYAAVPAAVLIAAGFLVLLYG